MKYSFVFLLFRMMITAELGIAQSAVETQTPKPVIAFTTADALLQRIAASGDTILLVNFWATWCKPCVKELPFFEKLVDSVKLIVDRPDKKRTTTNQQLTTNNFKLLLVSMDAKNTIDTRVANFIATKNIKSEVVVIDQTDLEKWVGKIEKRWAGAIPISILYRNGKHVFGNQEFESFEQLQTWVEESKKQIAKGN